MLTRTPTGQDHATNVRADLAVSRAAEPERRAKSRTVSVEEAADMLGVGRTTAYMAARSGQLPGVIRIGRRVVVSREAIERLLAGL